MDLLVVQKLSKSSSQLHYSLSTTGSEQRSQSQSDVYDTTARTLVDLP